MSTEELLVSNATQDIINILKKRYAEVQALNRVPSLLELAALSVQLVDAYSLTGSQKMLVVKLVVAGLVDQLPIPASEKAQMQAALFTVQNLAEVALSLIAANKRLEAEAQKLASAFSSRCCPGKVPIELKPVNIPFPLLHWNLYFF